MSCDTCQVKKLLEEALEYERERNKELQAKLVAMASPLAYRQLVYENAPDTDDYFGVGEEEFIEYDDFGQKIYVRKDPKKEEN